MNPWSIQWGSQHFAIYQPTLDEVSIGFQSRYWVSVDLVSTEYHSNCWSSVDRDINWVLKECKHAKTVFQIYKRDLNKSVKLKLKTINFEQGWKPYGKFRGSLQWFHPVHWFLLTCCISSFPIAQLVFSCHCKIVNSVNECLSGQLLFVLVAHSNFSVLVLRLFWFNSATKSFLKDF